MRLRYQISIIYLSAILALLLTVVSFSGVFISDVYQRETASLAAQGVGQDIFDLFIVVPLVLISLFYITKGVKTALFILGGTVLYITYSFFIYSFGIHFNFLFVLYCFTLGASFYLLVIIMTELGSNDVDNWFINAPSKSTAVFLIIIAVIFYYLWFSDIIPALLHNSVPESVSNYKLIVNPVHVLDLAFVLPGLVLASVLLIRKRKMGFILAPILLIFITEMSFALIAMALMLNLWNISGDFSLVAVFSVLAATSLIFSILFLSKLKIQKTDP